MIGGEVYYGPLAPDAISAMFSTPPVFIYALCEPDSGLVRYIGKTIRPEMRLKSHINERSRTRRCNWIVSLAKRGMMPDMVMLERLEGDVSWQLFERALIARYRLWGADLVNGTDGGDGVQGLNGDSLDRRRKAWLGRKHSPETIARLCQARVGFRHSEASKELLRQAHSGRTINWTDKIAAAIRKLTSGQVEQIKSRLAAGEGVQALAREYGVHRTTLSKIKTGTYCPALKVVAE